METINKKLKSFRKLLLDKEYPLGLDELLGEVEYLFEGDKQVSEKISSYIDDFYKMFDDSIKFNKIKEIVKESEE